MKKNQKVICIPQSYSKCYKTNAKPFNSEYAPKDWNKKISKEEPVIFYKYIGNKSSRTYEDFLKEVKSSKDYDESKEKRDKEIKK